MDNQECYKEYLAEIGEHISAGCSGETDLACRKGIIVGRENLDFVKNKLGFLKLQALHKVCELEIDDSWTACMTTSASNDNAMEFWNCLVKAAYNVRDGLLVLNVSNMKAFEHCWHLKQLAKQENLLNGWCNISELLDEDNGFLNFDELERRAERMRYDAKTEDEIDDFANDTIEEAVSKGLCPSKVDFKGYVLIVLDGLEWADVVGYAKVHNSSEFDAMMQFYMQIEI